MKGQSRVGSAVFVTSKDPRDDADHGRMRVLRTALDALANTFEHVDVITLRSNGKANPDHRENLSFHSLSTRQPTPIRMVRTASSGIKSGRASLNGTMGLGSDQLQAIEDRIRSPRDFWLIDGVRNLPALELARGAATFVDLDDLLSDRYEKWAQLPFEDLPFDIFGTDPSNPLNGVARSLRKRIPAVLRREAIQVAALERDAADRASAVSLVSQAEAAELSRRTGRGVHHLPMGVDVGSLTPRPDHRDFYFDAVFLGHVTHLPNLAGLRFLAQDVFPLLANQLGRKPRIAVAGKVSSSVQAWLHSAGLVPLGYVDDLSSLFSHSAVAVAPQVVDGGVNTKILDYARLGVPIAGTSAAFSGLSEPATVPWRPTSTAEEFADELLRCRNDQKYVRELRSLGWEYVQRHYDRNVVGPLWTTAFRHATIGQETSAL